jgi:hypothetical protein
MTRSSRLALAGAALAVACASGKPARSPASVTAVVVRASAQCGGEQSSPSARWLGSEGTFRAAMGAGGAFGAEPEPPLDFRREGVLAVYMGQRPTAGFSLALADAKVAIAGGVATVVVEFREPAPGLAQAQVLTSPCLLVRMPRGDLREVRVVDPGGTVRAQAAVRVAPAEPDEPRRRVQ